MPSRGPDVDIPGSSLSLSTKSFCHPACGKSALAMTCDETHQAAQRLRTLDERTCNVGADAFLNITQEWDGGGVPFNRPLLES